MNFFLLMLRYKQRFTPLYLLIGTVSQAIDVVHGPFVFTFMLIIESLNTHVTIKTN